MNILRLIFMSIIASALMQPASGHQIWLQKSDSGYELVYGENAAETDPLTFEKVDWVKGYTKNNHMDKLDVTTEAYGESPDAGHVNVLPFMDYPLLTAKMTNGYYVAVEDASAPRGYTYLKGKKFSDINSEGKTIVKMFKSIKFAKYISDWNFNMYWPVGQRLEIIPLTDVTKLKEGDTLKYVIYYEGRAVNSENTNIFPSSDPSLTGENNPKTALDATYFVQSVIIGPAGLQNVVVKHKEILNDEGTKYLSIASVLSFNTE